MLTAAEPEVRYQPERLQRPEGTQDRRVDWTHVGAFLFYHAAACLAFWPWLFDWTSVIVCLAGLYVFGTLGINLCFHRLLTHRSFACPRWLEQCLALLGVCCLQDTPARWVAIHRRHHQHSDEQEDPHSPLVNFFWGHFYWLVRVNADLERRELFDRYARDLVRDRFYRGLERKLMWVWINLVQWPLFFGAGYLLAAWSGGSPSNCMQFGLSLLVWGVFVRTVLVWHITWSVNSVTHLWGYRNYQTDENSRNNVLIGLISNGEGWHNNHHAQPRAAAHGHKWWELDITWMTIWVLQKMRLAWNIVPINRRMADAKTVKEY